MGYTFDDLKDRLEYFVKAELAASKEKHKYVCPYCGSGTHSKNTGAFSIMPGGKMYKCFSCGKTGDIYDLYGRLKDEPDPVAQYKGVCAYFNVTPDIATHTHIHIHTKTDPVKEQAVDYTEYFIKAHTQVTDTDYFTKRGLSEATINKYNLGYDPKWVSPKAKGKGKVYPSPRAIIPTSRTSYVARSTDPETKDYRYLKQGENNIYLPENLYNSERPVFIVEGELDALSIIEAGGVAAAIGGVGNRDKLIQLLQAKPATQPLYIALDNDEAGDKGSEELANKLISIGITPRRVKLYGEHKDANEALLADPEAFRKAIKEIEANQDEQSEAIKDEYLKTSIAGYLQEFVDKTEAKKEPDYIPTGFKELDNVLEFGLRPELYIIGAVSSLGKTTFALQIADQIAERANNDILIFSLEMPKDDLIAKSVSRHTAKIAYGIDQHYANAKTMLGIKAGYRYNKYTAKEKDIIGKAFVEYGNYCNRIFIVEGMGDVTASRIRATVQKHIDITGVAPIVVIDYLQIVAGESDYLDEKTKTDKTVVELKRLSRDLKVPVIAISSLNRANYNAPISMESFKESGGIEYSADVLLGLQLKGVVPKKKDDNKAKEKLNEAKRKDPRDIELVILKNRNGKTGVKIDFTFHAKFNLFTEKGLSVESND